MMRPAIAVSLLLCFSAGLAARADEPTFTGEFADGTYVTGGHVGNWHEPSAQPNLNGQGLFDANRPIRWLLNESAEPVAIPQAFVEMQGGDRLPGRVVAWQDGDARSPERLPAHVRVKVDVPVDLPNEPARAEIRVRSAGLRRIVWQRRSSDQYVPGTLFYTDGRRIAFRSARWSAAAVVLLLAEGTRRVAFGEIAELHLPAIDPWAAYYESLATLSADASTRLTQIETFAGLVVTTSLARLQAKSISGEPQGWFHALAPIWSLDPLWVRHTQIKWRRFFLPSEIPLSLIAPARSVERSSLGGSWRQRRDMSVQGNPLRNGARTYGWGLGVQAYSELHFSLPATARKFQTRVGLDESAGRGGCARGVVYLNEAQGTPSFQTNHLIGSAQASDSGAIDLGNPPAKSLVLVADPAIDDRPAGADPLDVRDLVDWLEPVLTLDLESIKRELMPLLPQAIVAWQDWQVDLQSGGVLRLNNRWDLTEPNVTRCRLEAAVSGGTLKLGRQVRVGPRDKYLLLAVSRAADVTTPAQIAVLIDGLPVTEFDVPQRRANQFCDPLLLSLAPWQGREIKLEIVQSSAGDQSWTDWRNLGFADYPTPTPWVPLENERVAAVGATKFERLADGSWLATGNPSEADTYTLTADTELLGISGFRLECLADPLLPGGGPGRGQPGFMVTDLRASIEPRGASQAPALVDFSAARADYANGDSPAARLIDTDPQSGWSTSAEPGQSHYATVTTAEDIGFAGGTKLQFSIDQRVAGQTLGRFKLLVTNSARPLTAERPGKMLPLNWVGRALALFEDQPEFLLDLREGGGAATLVSDDKFSGAVALKLVGDRSVAQLPRLPVKIRQNPAVGEYRYLQFAWKKVEGQGICLQVAHDGAWGPAGNFKFRYYAGSVPEPFGGALLVDSQLPSEWKLVTRDLFEDFGEFTLTGLGLAMIDGKYALFDRILLGRTAADFEPVAGGR